MKHYTGDPQFDFQIIRFTSRLKHHPEVMADLSEVGQAITDFESWYTWWTSKASDYEAQGKLDIAARYFRAAAFYLDATDPRKKPTLVHYTALFYQAYQGSPYSYHKIPYPGGYLPALRIECPGASRTLLVLGGFDGILEEMCDFVAPLQNQGYHLILFDGPGQGQTYQQGLTFQPNFEVPVKVVLDYFGLKSCDAMGLSWGGYFVMRAAAFEPRIQSVVCLDIFYSAMDALKLTLGPAAYSGFRLLYHLRAKSLINALTESFTKSNIQLKWSLQNGYQLTGEKTPYDFYRNLDRHQVAPILNRISQPCLLLAGQEDQYVPAYRLKQMKRKLIHAKAIESHLFTSQTGGALHCQMDRLDLVYPLVLDFLHKYSH